MRKMHQWEEMLPEEFFTEMARAPVAYWSCGAMEEHGLHVALGNDYIQMYEVCLRAARITGGIVFPPVPFAPAGAPPSYSRDQLRRGEHELYPPSLWVSRELCERLYTELLESLGRADDLEMASDAFATLERELTRLEPEIDALAAARGAPAPASSQ